MEPSGKKRKQEDQKIVGEEWLSKKRVKAGMN
jgi:hypothetical protein